MVEMRTQLAIERAGLVTLHLQPARRSSIPTVAKAISPESGADFTAVFGGLKEVMSAVEPALRAITDEPRKYYRATKAKSWKGGPMFFGASSCSKAT
jgi:hypothetical protein